MNQVRPVVYVAPGERTSPRWCKAFAAGCGGHLRIGGPLVPGPVALWGSPKLWSNVLQAARRERRTWYYGDHGYFARGRYYKVTRNALQHDGRGGAGPARFEALGLPLKPWRRGGSHVLVCPPNALFAGLVGFDAGEWLRDVVATLRANTDREIRVRDRDAAERSPVSLVADLEDAHVLVTYTSNAAVEALLEGVPVICTDVCAASAMGLYAPEHVEEPIRPAGRAQWAWNLADNQWTLAEISVGQCWERIGI